MKLLQPTCLLAILVSLAIPTSAQWMDIGETRLDISFKDANNGIMVGAAGLTMKTKDGGQSWLNDHSITEFATNLEKVFTFGNNVIALDRTPSFMGPSSHIYTSNDGGQHWTRRLTSNRFLMIHFVNANVGWYWDQSPYKNDEYPYRTTDGGITWTQTSDVLSISLMSSLGNTTWAWSSVGSDNFLSKSVDLGVTWTTQKIVPYVDDNYNTSAFQFVDDQHGWFSGESYNRMYKTSDGGASWQGIALPFPNQNENVWGMHFFDFNTGIVRTSNDILFKTNDGGTTWRIVLSSPENYSCHFKKIYFKDALNGFVVGTAGYLAATHDGGETWTQQSFSTVVTNEPILDLAFNGNEIWAVGDGLIQHSSDSRNWLVDPSSLIDFHEFQTIAFDQHGKGVYSTLHVVSTTNNNGASWSSILAKFDPVYPTTGLAVEKLFYDKDGNLWAKDYNGPLFKSTDGGQNFKLKRSFPSIFALSDYVTFQTPKDIWYYGHYWLLRSKDGGETWTQSIETITSMFFLNKFVGWKMLPGRLVYKTIDGGETWKYVSTIDALSDFKYSYFADEFTGWVVDVNSQTYKTSDGGKTWSQEAVGSWSKVNTVLFRVNENNKVEGYIGGEQLIKLSSNYTPVPFLNLTAPVSLSATTNNLAVTLQWVDNSTDKDGYIIERLNGSIWQEIGRTTAKSFQNVVPAFASYSYRVSVFKADRGIAVSQPLIVDVKDQPPAQQLLLAAVSPITGKTDVSVRAPLIMVFNQDVNLHASNLIVNYQTTSTTGTMAIPVDLTHATVVGSSVTLIGHDPFPSGASIQITIPGDMISSKANVFFAGSSDWKFNTPPIPDTESPKYVSLSPLNGGQDVDIQPTLTITFDEDIIFNRGAIQLHDATNTSTLIVVNETNTQVDKRIVTIQLPQALKESTKYSIAVPAGIVTDLAGNSFSLDKGNWTFTTFTKTPPPDIESPSVISLFPESSAIDIESPVSLQITFSEDIVFNGGELTIINSDDPTSRQTIPLTSDNVKINGKTVTITLAESLPEGAALSITVSSGTFIDKAGNVVDSNPINWKFSTRAALITAIEEKTNGHWIVFVEGDIVVIRNEESSVVVEGVYDVLGRPIEYRSSGSTVVLSKPSGLFLIRYNDGSKMSAIKICVR